MEDKSLSTAFADSLTEEAVSCISEYAEIGLDALMDDGILKDIPIVATAISLYKIGGSIKERHNLKKLMVFLNELNKGIADNIQRWDYINKFKNNEKFRNQEIEYLLVLIDRYISYDKAQMLAKLYLAYLNGMIIWEELTMYAEVVDRFLLLDCRTLIDGDGKTTVHRNIGGESVLRLVALGLMAETTETSPFTQHGEGRYGLTSEGLKRSLSTDRVYRRTEFGDNLAEILKQKDV